MTTISSELPMVRGAPLSITTANPTVKIGGNPLPATDGFFSSLAPSYLGLYQVNVQVRPARFRKTPWR